MHKVKIEPIFYIFIAIALMLLPARLVIAWFAAVTIHELFHYFALRLLGVNIRDITISISGVKMQIDDLQGYKEIICALAGPFGGFLLLLLSRWLPCTAILGTLHSCFNLLPVFTLDGGRALRVVLIKQFGISAGECIHQIASYAVTVLLIILGMYVCLRFNLSFGTFLIVCILFAGKAIRKIPCKPFKQIVQ